MKHRKVRIEVDNSEFQFVETLRRNRTKRQRHGAFFVEGVRSINAVIHAGWQIQGIYHAYDRPLSDWAKQTVSATHEATVFQLAGPLMAQLSQRDEPSELVMVVRIPDDDPSRIPIDENLLVVLVDRPASPGNLGTLIRSCDALGAHGVVITGHATDLYSPEVVRATTGSLFALPIVRLPSHREALSWVAELKVHLPRLHIVGSSAQASSHVFEHDFRMPTILCLGNETWGLSKNYRTACDTVIRIPMPYARTATSLNMACAATTLLYEVQRQRAKSTESATHD